MSNTPFRGVGWVCSCSCYHCYNNVHACAGERRKPESWIFCFALLVERISRIVLPNLKITPSRREIYKNNLSNCSWWTVWTQAVKNGHRPWRNCRGWDDCDATNGSVRCHDWPGLTQQFSLIIAFNVWDAVLPYNRFARVRLRVLAACILHLSCTFFRVDNSFCRFYLCFVSSNLKFCPIPANNWPLFNIFSNIIPTFVGWNQFRERSLGCASCFKVTDIRFLGSLNRPSVGSFLGREGFLCERKIQCIGRPNLPCFLFFLF